VGSRALALSVEADWAAVRAGAGGDLAVLVPVVALYTALHATGVISGDTGVIVTAVAAVLVAPVAGGVIAGRRGSGATPLTDSALASGIGAMTYVVFRVGDAVVRGRTVTVAGLVILVMLSVAVGVMGGFVGARTRPAGEA
jgi:hypothetical protein